MIFSIRKIQGPFREFGFGAGCLYAAHRVLNRLSARWNLHVYDLMVQPITDKQLLPPKFLSHVEVREIDSRDPEMAQMPVRPEVLAARIRQNSTCLGAFRKGEFVGYMWFCRNEYAEDEVRCVYALETPRESVFDFDFYLFPKHRMGLAFGGLWNGVNEFLRAQEIRYTFSRLTRFNVQSRRAHKHLGLKRVGRAIFLQLGRAELMVATVAPYVSMTISGWVRLRLRQNVPFS